MAVDTPSSKMFPVRRTLILTSLIVIAEPLSATILLPFVFFMVRSFARVDDQYVGFWCGIVSRFTAEVDPWLHGH